jgi:hypothetical protein
MAFSFWGHIPQTPCHGGLRPLDPRFPTPAGLGFASVLGPTRGRVAGGDNSPLLGFVGGTPHNPPPWGLRPLDPSFSHPRGLRVRQRFGSHSWRVC